MAFICFAVSALCLIAVTRSQDPPGGPRGPPGGGDGPGGDHHGGDRHHHGGMDRGPFGYMGPPIGLFLECANSSCISDDIKTNIRSKWAPGTVALYNNCSKGGSRGVCSPENKFEVLKCVFADRTSTPAMQAEKDFSNQNVLDCCGNTITMTMLNCLMPPHMRGGPGGFEHGGRDGPGGRNGPGGPNGTSTR